MAGMEANRKDQFRRNPRRVYSSDSSATKGKAAFYDLTNTTIALRHKNVIGAAPNSESFAGVFTDDLTRAQMTTIQEPGKSGTVAKCLIGEAVATAPARVWADQADGKFYTGGIDVGRGSGLLLETVSADELGEVWLDDGNLDAVVQNLATPASGALSPAPTAVGMTILDGTAATGGLTYTLADGTIIGQTKGFIVGTAIGASQDLVITVTNGVQIDGATALATITMNAADEQAILQWNGAAWQLQSYSGATLA